MNSEIELKLAIAERDVWRLLRLPMLHAVTVRRLPSRQLQSTYYDTTDHRLHQQGIAVRLRQVEHRWLQTVKTEGRVIAGLHERPEWEIETTENTLDFSRLPDARLKALLEKTLDGAALQPVFRTDFTRLSRILRLGDGSVCEFSLDRGKIVAGDIEKAIAELELEIIAGEPASLFDFVRSLLDHVPLTLARDSKAARGFALVLGAPAKPVKAREVTLDKRMTVREGFIAIAAACMDHLSANVAGCMVGEDAEYLHQMRVAIRRLRTAMHLFADHLDAEKMDPLVDELRWLGGQLGATRDFDVFLAETLPPLMAMWPNHVGLLQLRERIAEQRNAAMAASRAAIHSPRNQRLQLDIGAWLVAMSRQASDCADASRTKTLLEFACAALQRHRKQLMRRSDNLLDLSPEQRHRVRISAKRLRYAAEFFASMFSAKRSASYIEALAELQAMLGALNDAATTQTILSKARYEPSDALAIVQAWTLGACQGHLAHLRLVHKRFLQQKIFW